MDCQRLAHGTVYCQEHSPAAAAAGPPPDVQNPYVQPELPQVVTAVSTSPALAFVLGFIPGVGAIYNGQYLKGLMHAVVFGLIVSLLDSAPGGGAPLLGILLAAFVFYMPFEAYHTAKKRLMGLPVEEFSSLVSHNRFSSRTPIGPILLIVIGVLFLLDTLGMVQFRDIARFWPVLLIVAGGFMLYNRVGGPIAQRPTEVIRSEYVEPRQ